MDLYKKLTDKNQYLLPYSCHPQEATKSIPFSLALRITRICTNPDTREKHFGELKKMLLDRHYKSSMIDSSIRRARQIPRDKALQRVAKPNNNKRPISAVTWDPRLPNLPQVQGKHWRSMTLLSPYMREVFPKPPLVAYKTQKNISDFFIRAKVPPPPKNRPYRRLNGMKKCQHGCVICPFIREGKTVKGKDFTWNLNRPLNCNTRNIVYMIECNLPDCKNRYIGESNKTQNIDFQSMWVT